MSEQSVFYDLGEIHAATAARATARRQKAAAAVAERSALPALAASVALFVPGAGHLVLREFQVALFFSATLGCLAAVGWALWRCLDGLLPTLSLLGVASWSVGVAFVTIYLLAATLHVASVLDAHGARLHVCLARRPHAIVAALFSAVIPGWGQVLVGKRGRAVPLLPVAPGRRLAPLPPRGPHPLLPSGPGASARPELRGPAGSDPHARGDRRPLGDRGVGCGGVEDQTRVALSSSPSREERCARPPRS
jgi:hypothetical protein